MQKQLAQILLAALMLPLAALHAANPLEQNFQHPPADCRPWVYWTALNGNLTREGITADLEAMARVGIGGVLYLEVDQGTPKGPADFAGPLWRELFQHACKEAHRLGLEINMNNDAGWCGSGGPWITPELSMQKVVWSETIVTGGKPFAGALPQPESVKGFYRDIAVLAFPTPAGDDETLGAPGAKFTASGISLKPGCFSLPPPDEKQPQFVQVESPRPFTARTLRADLSSNLRRFNVYCTLEISDDGQTFKPVKSFTATPPTLVLNFEPVTARFFRLTFTKRKYPQQTKLDIGNLELSPRYRTENILTKAAFIREYSLPTMPAKAEWPSVPAGVGISRGQIVDLTAKMDAGGKLSWDVPEGKWTVVRFGRTTTGKDNHPAPESGMGLECDKLSKEAAAVHFNGLMGRIIADNAGLAGQGKTLVSTHIDSWEVGSQNWTPKMREEFRKRRGYDLVPFLPAFSGRVVDSVEVTERFLWDLRRTVSELLVENYAGEFRRLANQHGLRLSIEAYDGPADDMTYAGQADEPMGEFWAWDKFIGSGWCLEMASAAHTYGKKILGAEAFTSNDREKWQSHPANIKDLGDWAFCEGINRFVFHRYAAQPWTNRAPGICMGPWGLHYERTQTWWEMSKPWHEYLARCQYLLREGLFVADVLYLQPEGAPHRFEPPTDAFAARESRGGYNLDDCTRGGYNFDGCTPEVVLTRLSVKDGRLVLPDGMSYRVLVLPKVETMTPRLLRKIKELADAGATVIGDAKPPVNSPSLADKGAGDAEVKKLAGELWASGKVITGKTPAQLLGERGVQPDFSAQPVLRYIHRTLDGAEVYFVANPQPKDVEALASFRIAGKRPELWNPETGHIAPAVAFEEKDGVTQIPLHLEPSGSVFVVFRKEAKGRQTVAGTGTTAAARNWLEFTPKQTISGPWQVQFDPKWGGPTHPVIFDQPEDWSKRPEEGIKYYSGTATYQTTFQFPPTEQSSRTFLDLGNVAVMAQVLLNGKDLGILWKPPFRVEVGEALKAGENTLELRVVNLWSNRLIGDEQLPEDSERNADGTLKFWPQWVQDGKPSPTGRYTFATHRLYKKADLPVTSGLLGPVRLMSAK